jgi:hypothetical protein
LKPVRECRRIFPAALSGGFKCEFHFSHIDVSIISDFTIPFSTTGKAEFPAHARIGEFDRIRHYHLNSPLNPFNTNLNEFK